MSRGNMIIGVAALVAFICFFLPWAGAFGFNVSGSWLASNAKGQLWITFIGILGCLAAVVLAFMSRITNKIASYIAIGLAALGLIMILTALGGGLGVRAGLIFTILAELAIIGGGALNLYEKV